MLVKAHSRTPFLSLLAICLLANLAHSGYLRPTVATLQADLAWPYGAWLNQDVAYIITPEERAAFLELTADEDRNSFIEQFWLRRNPDPKSLENEWELEHYRRLAYANQHFASAKPGWQTDRGHFYIVFGQPDEIHRYPTGRPQGPPEEAGDSYPYEKWHYKYLEGGGENYEVEFVDAGGKGEYRITLDDAEQKFLFRTDLADALRPDWVPFIKIEQDAGGQVAPIPRFKDLSALIAARIVRAQLVFERSYLVEPLTDCTGIANIKIEIPESELRFGEDSKVKVQIFGRIVNSTGRIQATFEEELSSEADSAGNSRVGASTLSLSKSVPLFYGSYTLQVAIKDPATGGVGIERIPLILPRPSQN